MHVLHISFHSSPTDITNFLLFLQLFCAVFFVYLSPGRTFDFLEDLGLSPPVWLPACPLPHFIAVRGFELGVQSSDGAVVFRYREDKMCDIFCDTLNTASSFYRFSVDLRAPYSAPVCNHHRLQNCASPSIIITSVLKSHPVVP